MTPAEVLHAAADLIEQRGWTQGRLEDEKTGCLCAAGAIRAAINATDPPAIGGTGIYSEAWQRLADFVGATVPEWNDHIATSAAEVVATLRAAAATEGAG